MDNCSVCHGLNGNGTLQNKSSAVEGFYPAPALNRISDELLKPLKELAEIIESSKIKQHGFGGKLSESEKLAVIAAMQNFWTDQDYKEWLKWGGLE